MLFMYLLYGVRAAEFMDMKTMTNRDSMKIEQDHPVLQWFLAVTVLDMP